jgi:hypothetical protein
MIVTLPDNNTIEYSINQTYTGNVLTGVTDVLGNVTEYVNQIRNARYNLFNSV